MNSNHYTTLEVESNATFDEIKKSYRRLSLRYHPDKGGNEEDFKKLTEAYEILYDPSKREEYDFMLSRKAGGGPGPGPGSVPGMPDLNNVQEMFNNLFAGNTTNLFFNLARAGGIKPQPIIIKHEMSMKQVYSGGTFPIEIERCIVENDVKTTERETLYVAVHSGVDNGEFIIIRDKGHIFNGTVFGDVKIIISVVNNTEFVRKGIDLILTKTITLKQALCGFNIEIQHINGTIYTFNNMTNSVIITPDSEKVVAGIGLVRGEHKGNLIIRFQIEFPKTLESNKIEELRRILP